MPLVQYITITTRPRINPSPPEPPPLTKESLLKGQYLRTAENMRDYKTLQNIVIPTSMAPPYHLKKKCCKEQVYLFILI